MARSSEAQATSGGTPEHACMVPSRRDGHGIAGQCISSAQVALLAEFWWLESIIIAVDMPSWGLLMTQSDPSMAHLSPVDGLVNVQHVFIMSMSYFVSNDSLLLMFWYWKQVQTRGKCCQILYTAKFLVGAVGQCRRRSGKGWIAAVREIIKKNCFVSKEARCGLDLHSWPPTIWPCRTHCKWDPWDSRPPLSFNPRKTANFWRKLPPLGSE